MVHSTTHKRKVIQCNTLEMFPKWSIGINLNNNSIAYVTQRVIDYEYIETCIIA